MLPKYYAASDHFKIGWTNMAFVHFRNLIMVMNSLNGNINKITDKWLVTQSDYYCKRMYDAMLRKHNDNKHKLQ